MSGCQELAVEVGRDAVERPRRRVALVAAHAQPADLLAEVDEVVRVAELGRPAWTPSIGSVNRYWWAIGMIGTVTPTRRADLRREHAAGVDDDVGPDLVALAARARRSRP